MHQFLQFTVLGIVYGAVYAVAASGLVVTYATSGVFNFATGAIGMVAAFTYWDLTQAHDLSPLVALAVVLLVEAPILGVVIERVLMRRLFGASAERALMVTLGLMVVLMGAAGKVWAAGTARSVPFFFPSSRIVVAGVYVEIHKIIVVGIAAVVAVALWLLLRFTRPGEAQQQPQGDGHDGRDAHHDDLVDLDIDTGHHDAARGEEERHRTRRAGCPHLAGRSHEHDHQPQGHHERPLGAGPEQAAHEHPLDDDAEDGCLHQQHHRQRHQR